MNSRLKAGQPCPLHRGRKDCCGRAPFTPRPGKNPQRFGITFMADGREICSPAKLRERKDQMIRRGDSCGFCGEAFTDYSEIELCHDKSKGSGGFKKDDSWGNIFLGHKAENCEQGSRPLADYLALRREKGLPTP